MSHQQRKVLVATGIGHFVEWFDFGLYGTLATIIGMQFFHTNDPATALLSSFAVFGAGFVIRPLGGLWFGSLGDRIGRRKVLATVILLTSGATFTIGLLPTYAQAGLFATVLLVLVRMIQGFAAGGESAGATTFLAEYAPANRRGYFTCWTDSFGFMAFVAGSGLVLLLTTLLGEAAMNDWGWRIPFLLAGPLGWIGLYLRNHLQDSPEFEALRKSHQTEPAPLHKAVTSGRRRWASASGLWRSRRWCTGCCKPLFLLIWWRRCTFRRWMRIPSPLSGCWPSPCWCLLWATCRTGLAVSR